MSRISYSVSIVATVSDGRLYGKTINTLMPVSADKPYSRVTLRGGAATAKVIESGCFCVSVLSEDQKAIAEDFAKS